jgi:hypothetical protein
MLHKLTDHEKWSTVTKFNISFATKLSFSLFLNTALITVAVEVLTFHNFYGVGGLIQTESFMFIMNALFPPLCWLIDPWSILKNYQRNKLKAEKVSSLT